MKRTINMVTTHRFSIEVIEAPQPATGNKYQLVPCVACTDGTLVVIHPRKFTAERIQCPDCKGTMKKPVPRKGATHG